MMKRAVIPAKGIMQSGDAGGLSVVVQEEKLDEKVRKYLELLVKKHPFHLDMGVDNRRVMPQLADIWPEILEYNAQAYEIWERIDRVVQSIPAITLTPAVIIRISADSVPLAPFALPQPDAPAAFVSFDSMRGIMSHYVMPASDEAPPSLEALAVASGITLVCQPTPMLFTRSGDNRKVELGAGNDIYLEDRKDPPMVAAPATPIVNRSTLISTPPPPPQPQ